MQEEKGSDLKSESETEYKNMAIEYFKLVAARKFKEGLRFFTLDCTTHNPYVAGSMESLTDAMIMASKDMSSRFPESELTVKNVLVDGEFVAVHTELLNSKSKPSEGGLRQVHIFHFNGGKIVEYWDITQQVLPEMPNAIGAF